MSVEAVVQKTSLPAESVSSAEKSPLVQLPKLLFEVSKVIGIGEVREPLPTFELNLGIPRLKLEIPIPSSPKIKNYTGQVVPNSALLLNWNKGIINHFLTPKLIFYGDEEVIDTPEKLTAYIQQEGKNFDLTAFALRALWQMSGYKGTFPIPGKIFREANELLSDGVHEFVARKIRNPQTGQMEVYFLYIDPHAAENVATGIDNSRVVRITFGDGKQDMSASDMATLLRVAQTSHAQKIIGENMGTSAELAFK